MSRGHPQQTHAPGYLCSSCHLSELFPRGPNGNAWLSSIDNVPSQLLSSVLIALTTFISNDSLRYFALGSMLLSLVGYTVFVNNLSSQAARCETIMQEIELEALFITITKECARDLRFIAEVGLQLTL
jgi:hypothetical protein